MPTDPNEPEEPSLLEGLAEEGDGPSNQARPAVSSPGGERDAVQLEELAIQDLWCYREAEIAFEDGITVIAGPNGSGKSSLLESLFFALYGSKARPIMGRALGDVLRLNADRGSARLAFRFGGHRYEAEMALRTRGEQVQADSDRCRLRRDGDEIATKPTEVTQTIESLLRMTAEDFANCVYVRQGEIDRLIRADSDERRSMIDRLLRLEDLDRYTERAKEGAQRALNRKRDFLEHLARDLGRQLRDLDAEDLDQRIAQTERQIEQTRQTLASLEDELAQAQAQRQEIQGRIDTLRDQIETIREREAERDRKAGQIERNERRASELKADRDRLRQRYRELEAQLARSLEPLELDADAVRHALADAEQWEDVTALAEAMGEVDDELASVDEELRRAQHETNDPLQTAMQQREAAQADLAQLEARIDHVESEIRRKRELIEEGRCPTCGQPIHDEAFEEPLNEQQETLSSLRRQHEETASRRDELAERVEQLRQQAEQRTHQLHEKRQSLQNKRRQLETAKDVTLEMLKVKDQGQDRRRAHQDLQETLQAEREEKAELDAEIAELRANLGDPEELSQQRTTIDREIERLQSRKEQCQNTLSELNTTHGQLQSRQQQREQTRDSHEQAERERAEIEALQAEVAELSSFYGTFKRELRSRNVAALEHYLNAFFRVMDADASYRRVRVSADYDLTIELVDGETIEPHWLSGGERALLNIALRAAIHQVLSHATVRLPLVLDEPTVYLDAARVNRLQELLEELGTRVGQIVFVSHEDRLVEGADHAYRTVKAPDNTSRIERVR